MLPCLLLASHSSDFPPRPVVHACARNQEANCSMRTARLPAAPGGIGLALENSPRQCYAAHLPPTLGLNKRADLPRHQLVIGVDAGFALYTSLVGSHPDSDPWYAISAKCLQDRGRTVRAAACPVRQVPSFVANAALPWRPHRRPGSPALPRARSPPSCSPISRARPKPSAPLTQNRPCCASGRSSTPWPRPCVNRVAPSSKSEATAFFPALAPWTAWKIIPWRPAAPRLPFARRPRAAPRRGCRCASASTPVRSLSRRARPAIP